MFYIVVLVVQNKNLTSKGKPKNSRKCARTITSSQTSAQVSTSRDPDCVPYWTNVTKDWSTKLLSCIKKDLCDFDSICWNSCFKNLVQICNSQYMLTSTSKNQRTRIVRDLLTIINVFLASNNGKREVENRSRK